MGRRIFINGFLGCALAALLCFSGPGQALASEADLANGAKAFIDDLTTEAINTLTAADIDKFERRKRFRQLMQDKFAFKGIAKWVLGRYWRQATEDERNQFVSLFEDLMVVTYADRFANYAGEKIHVISAEVRNGQDALVHSNLIRAASSDPVDVIWRVRRIKDQYKVVDVMVEGLSMGLTQQKEFTSVIRNNGGRVDGLLVELRKRLKSNT